MKPANVMKPMKAACEAALAAEDNAEVKAAAAAPEVAELSELLCAGDSQIARLLTGRKADADFQELELRSPAFAGATFGT